jgi:hypothetical protein
MQPSELLSRIEALRVLVREACARRITADEQTSLDELTRTMRRLLEELDPLE